MSECKIVESDELHLIKQTNDENIYVFYPTLFRVFPKSGNTCKITLKKYGRFLLLFMFSKFRVYILTTKDNIVKCTMGFSRGGSFRYPFSTKNDLIDGPSFTVPSFRGQGTAVRLADFVINEYEKDYKKVYGTIKNDNISSLKRAEKNGYVVVNHCRYNLLKRCVIDESGDMSLVEYVNKRASQ